MIKSKDSCKYTSVNDSMIFYNINMKAKILKEQGIYYLTTEVRNDSFYKTFLSSTPLKLDNISINGHYDIENDAYVFNINECTLNLSNCCPDFFLLEFLKKILSYSDSAIIVTLINKDSYYYIAAIHQSTENDDTRFIILENKPESKNYTVINDFIISSYKFIETFNKLLHKIYNRDFPWLIEHYVDECFNRTTVVNQEYTLTTMKKYIDIFDNYLTKPKNYFNSNGDKGYKSELIINYCDSTIFEEAKGK